MFVRVCECAGRKVARACWCVGCCRAHRLPTRSSLLSLPSHRCMHVLCHTWVRGLLWSRCEPHGEKAAGRQSWTGILAQRFDFTETEQHATCSTTPVVIKRNRGTFLYRSSYVLGRFPQLSGVIHRFSSIAIVGAFGFVSAGAHRVSPGLLLLLLCSRFRRNTLSGC